MTRVIIVDDQALFREGLRTVLSLQGIDVVGEAANGEEAVKLAERLAPDVVLMDLRMPVLDGVEATRRIAKLPRSPPTTTTSRSSKRCAPARSDTS